MLPFVRSSFSDIFNSSGSFQINFPLVKNSTIQPKSFQGESGLSSHLGQSLMGKMSLNLKIYLEMWNIDYNNYLIYQFNANVMVLKFVNKT